MEIGACSEIGRVRSMNEDHYTILTLPPDVHVFIIADGMGGHKAGEVASKMAVELTHDFLETNYNTMLDNIPELIKSSIIHANKIIFNKSRESVDFNDMGTTLTLGMIFEGVLYVGHIGDSRIYLIRNERIKQISKDHSLVAELVRKGKLSEEDAHLSPYKNIITRALGTEENIDVDLFEEKLLDDDILLLCTDGLTNLVDEEEISNICSEFAMDIEKVPKKLVELANYKGGYDNITVIAAKYRIYKNGN